LSDDRNHFPSRKMYSNVVGRIRRKACKYRGTHSFQEIVQIAQEQRSYRSPPTVSPYPVLEKDHKGKERGVHEVKRVRNEGAPWSLKGEFNRSTVRVREGE